MEVVDHLKIQDRVPPPCWIFVFAIHSLNCRKSNIEENIFKFGDSSHNRMKVIGNLKIEDGCRSSCWIFILATYTLSRGKSSTEEIKTKLAHLSAT